MEAAKHKKGAEPPPRLVFAWWCEKYQTLPDKGSLLEQVYREMYLNDVLPSIYRAVQNWRLQGGVGLSNADSSMILWLVNTGLMNKRLKGRS